MSSKDVTVDIIIGGLGKADEAISSAAQRGLLDAFQNAKQSGAVSN